MSLPKAKLLRILVVLVLVALGAALGYRYWVNENHDDGALLLYGNVDQREVELAFVLQERITRLHVEEGDRVNAGQLLAELDPARYEQAAAEAEAALEVARQQLAALEHGSRPEEIRRARADLASARAAEEDAEANYRRVKELLAQKLVSPQQVDNARAALDIAHSHLQAAQENLALMETGPREEDIALARARVKGAEAGLARAQKDLADTRLYAPDNGIIQARILEPGDIAGPQKPVFTLALLNPLWVRAYVSETELGKVRQGLPARIFTDTYPGKAYTGQVGFISPTAEFTPKTVQTNEVRSSLVYQVRIIVADAAEELRPGMPVTVDIALPETAPAEAATDAGQ